MIIPKENEKDLDEIDQTVRRALRFLPVETVDAVFAAAFVQPQEMSAAVDHMAILAAESNTGCAGLRV